MPPVLRSTRGAVFLLAVYLSALMLLLLGGVSLQRTTSEVKASETSRNLQQAFWGAEAGLDQALTYLRQDKPLPLGMRNAELAAAARQASNGGSQYTTLGMPKNFADGTYGPFTTSSGTYMVKVQTTKIGGITPNGMQLTRTFTVTGTSASRQATVKSTVISDNVPLSGIFANGNVTLGDTLLLGSIHTRQGTPVSVFINDSVGYGRIFGDVTVGPPNAEHPYDQLYGPANQDGYAEWAAAPGATAAVGIRSLFMRPNRNIRQIVTGEVAAVEMPSIQPISRAPRRESFRGETIPTTLEVPDHKELTIKDGDLIDTSNALHHPDGKIVLDLDYLNIGYDAQVTTNAPTEVYLRDHFLLEDTGTPLGYGVEAAAYVAPKSVFVALDPAKESEGKQSAYKDGVKLLVTANANPGAVIVDGPRAFFGSIWAPQSTVSVSANDSWVNDLKYMFTDEDLKHFDWDTFYAKNYDPKIPGKTKGLVNQYVIANEMRGNGGCSSLFVQAATAGQQANNASATLTGWHNTQDRVTTP